jgi:hypothetical protein
MRPEPWRSSSRRFVSGLGLAFGFRASLLDEFGHKVDIGREVAKQAPTGPSYIGSFSQPNGLIVKVDLEHDQAPALDGQGASNIRRQNQPATVVDVHGVSL